MGSDREFTADGSAGVSDNTDDITSADNIVSFFEGTCALVPFSVGEDLELNALTLDDNKFKKLAAASYGNDTSREITDFILYMFVFFPFEHGFKISSEIGDTDRNVKFVWEGVGVLGSLHFFYSVTTVLIVFSGVENLFWSLRTDTLIFVLFFLC